MSALLPAHGDRPVWATTLDGVKVCVSTHDTWYLEVRRTLRAELVAVHPDRHGSPVAWERARRRLEAHDRAAVVWYEDIGLEPPVALKGRVKVSKPQGLIGKWVGPRRVTVGRKMMRPTKERKSLRETAAFCRLVQSFRLVWPPLAAKGI